MEISVAEASSLFPGFYFSPTDEELIQYYLKKKLQGSDEDVGVITEVDMCKNPGIYQGTKNCKTRNGRGTQTERKCLEIIGLQEAVDLHAAMAASVVNHEVEDVLELDGEGNSASNDKGTRIENATQTSLPEDSQRCKRRSTGSRIKRMKHATSPGINSIPEYVADKHQFYSTIQSFNANQRDVMNARFKKN